MSIQQEIFKVATAELLESDISVSFAPKHQNTDVLFNGKTVYTFMDREWFINNMGTALVTAMSSALGVTQ